MTTPTATADLAAIKRRQQMTWSSGDYALIGTTLSITGELLCEAVDVRPGQRVLDVAAGNGNATLAAARRWADVTSTDYVPALLERGRERAVAERLPVSFQVADAEALPFPDASFARVLALGLLEHCARPDMVLAEARRVLQPGGVLRLRTLNRYSLLPEPHVGVWGVGFVPRRQADRYVRWRSGQRYLHHRPLSRRELASSLRNAGLREVRVGAAPLLRSEALRLGSAARRLAPLYEQTRRIPLLREPLAWVAPLLEARGSKA